MDPVSQNCPSACNSLKHLIWNNKLKILDYFLCLPNDDFRYLDPVPPNCTNAPNTLKQVKLDPHIEVWPHLMWNDELNTLSDLLCLPNHDLWYLGPIWAQFPEIALMPEIPKTAKTWPFAFCIWARHYWMWNNKLLTLDYSFCLPNHDFR